MRIILAIVKLSRPVNVVIAIISIFIAVFITGTLQPWQPVVLACLTGGLVMAGANTVNDFFDLEIDRINKPHRPLPAGSVSRKLAVTAALVEFASGIVFASLINQTAFAVALIISILLFFYSFQLKRLPLWGNLTVSFSAAMAFVYGGIAVNRIRLTLVPAAFAFFYHLGREIIKDVQDMQGDGLQKARTFPLVFGKNAALQLTTINFILLMILTMIPFFLNWYGYTYFMVLLVGIYPVLIYSLISIWKNQSIRNLGIVSNVLKADMLVGLLAVYLG